MTDLYFILGLTREATHADIRQAYRSLSLLCHPDIEGGDAAQFERVKEAHDILTDEESRKFYDETGQIKSRPVEGAENAELYGLITQLLMGALTNIADVDRVNLTETMRVMLHDNRLQVEAQRKSMAKQQKRLQSVKDRMRRKAGATGDDILSKLLDGQLYAVAGALERLDANLAIQDRAKEFIEQYNYDFDQQRSFGQPPNNTGAFSHGGP